MYVQVIRILDRDQAITALANLRQEWETTSGGSLINSSIGWILHDIADALNFTEEEQRTILGEDLYSYLQERSSLPVSFVISK